MYTQLCFISENEIKIKNVCHLSFVLHLRCISVSVKGKLKLEYWLGTRALLIAAMLGESKINRLDAICDCRLIRAISCAACQ